MAELFTSIGKRLDAGQISRVQPDRGLSRYRADGGKQRLDPVSKAIGLFGNGAAGARAGKTQNGVVD